MSSSRRQHQDPDDDTGCFHRTAPTMHPHAASQRRPDPESNNNDPRNTSTTTSSNLPDLSTVDEVISFLQYLKDEVDKLKKFKEKVEENLSIEFEDVNNKKNNEKGSAAENQGNIINDVRIDEKLEHLRTSQMIIISQLQGEIATVKAQLKQQQHFIPQSTACNTRTIIEENGQVACTQSSTSIDDPPHEQAVSNNSTVVTILDPSISTDRDHIESGNANESSSNSNSYFGQMRHGEDLTESAMFRETLGQTLNSVAGNNHQQRQRQVGLLARFFNFQTQNVSDETRTMPQNSYSFLICSKTKTKPFFIGIVVFALQIITTWMMILNLVNMNNAAKEPIRVPPNVDHVVRVTQFIAIIISVLIQDDIRTIMEQLLEGYRIGEVFQDASRAKFWIVCLTQYGEALLVLLASFFLIVNAEDIESVLLNFTAVGFISVLDKVAFQLAISGFFGKSNMAKAKQLLDIEYKRIDPVSNPKYQKHRTSIAQFALLIMYCLLIISWGLIVHAQVSGAYLCKQIHVQFGDDMAAFSGLYDMKHVQSNHGRVEYIERRRPHLLHYTNEDTIPQNARGRFAFCAEQNVWTFSLSSSSDPCDWKARATEEFKYDIRETLSIPWEFQDSAGTANSDFRLSCFDSESCNGEECTCDNNMYGILCNLKNPCPVLAVKGTTNYMHWQQSFEMLQFSTAKSTVGNNITNLNKSAISASSRSVQAYHRPIYVGKTIQRGVFDIILFTGRRWILTNNQMLAQGSSSSSDETYYAPLKNATNHTGVVDFFLNAKFHSMYLLPDSVTLISEPAIDTSSANSLTPVGLKWYYPQHSDVKRNAYGLPIPDLNRPGEGILFYAFCNDATNPCMFEGECQPSDGTCKCKYGARGTLCEQVPTRDGICNPYFNSIDFDFDGGDCCAATCQNEKDCGVSSLSNGFGADLFASADGYPHCKDPAMVPITIYMKTTFTIFLGVHLSCSVGNIIGNTTTKAITYLNMKFFSLFYDVFEGSEVVYVQDGAECELILDADETYLFLQGDDSPSYAFEIYAGKVPQSLLDKMHKADIDHKPLIGKDKFMLGAVEGIVESPGLVDTLPFLVIKSCLFKSIPHVDMNTLNDLNTPQGKALRWLNSDTSVRSSCTSISSASQQHSTALQQRYALAVLNFAMDDMPRNISNLWLTDAHECDWRPGISCNSENLVTAIQLQYRGLSGELAAEIGMLRNLVKLNLGYNNLRGTIPSQIGDLLDLEEMQLYHNAFRGTMPTEIGKLEKLEILYLAINRLNGKLPSELGNLLKLKSFAVPMNGFSGQIPEQMFNLVHMKDFVVTQNRLSGTLPARIKNWVNLKTLSLSYNSFSGTIPNAIGNLIKMEALILDNNKFSGSIPSIIGNISLLNTWMFDHNSFTGTIPTEMGLLLESNSLNMGWNSIVGTIPSSLGNLSKLSRFLVDHNFLTGTIPTELAKLSSLKFLDLTSNQLAGSFPTKIGDLNKLKWVLLSQNQISGTMPENLCYASNLQQVVVDCNRLVCPSKCNCRGVDVEDNRFSCLSSTSEYQIDCGSGYVKFHVELIPGISPNETSWEFVVDGEIMLQGGSRGSWICIPNDTCGTFRINDSGGDGICCNDVKGFGSYTLFLDDKMIAYGGEFRKSETVRVGLLSCNP